MEMVHLSKEKEMVTAKEKMADDMNINVHLFQLYSVPCSSLVGRYIECKGGLVPKTTVRCI